MKQPEPTTPHQDSIKTQQEPTRNRSDYVVLVDIWWVLISCWWVPVGFLKKELKWFDWYWLYLSRFVKRETTRTDQNALETKQNPAGTKQQPSRNPPETQEPIRTHQEPNKNWPELRCSGWLLVGHYWVLAGYDPFTFYYLPFKHLL